MKSVKDRLRDGETVIGTSSRIGHPVELLADSGFDMLFFDTQHSPVDIKSLLPQIQAMKGRKAIPIIRVARNDTALICYALDVGAKGIIVPMVNSKEETIDLQRSCKYQPEGIRSAAGMRGDWGEFTREEFGEYAATVNKEVLIIPMIETLEALSNLEDIVSVPGVDVALIGPLDLSISLGMPQDFLNPKYQAALDKVIEICEKAGVAPGIYNVPGGQTPDDFIARGFRVFTLPWERWATAGIKDGLSKIDR